MSNEVSLDIALAARLDSLQTTVAGLEKQLARAGREQLKANALAEAQAERLEGALAALRVADERRASELADERQRGRVALSEARLDVVRAVLPVLDGLDDALRAGRASLSYGGRANPPTSTDALLQQLLLGSAETAQPPRREPLRANLEAWLVGLEMVRRRLLDALAAEGVMPIESEGQPFDPRRHVAVEVIASDAVPGTVLQELRRGFVAGERILRHAEVGVAGQRKPS